MHQGLGSGELSLFSLRKMFFLLRTWILKALLRLWECEMDLGSKMNVYMWIIQFFFLPRVWRVVRLRATAMESSSRALEIIRLAAVSAPSATAGNQALEVKPSPTLILIQGVRRRCHSPNFPLFLCVFSLFILTVFSCSMLWITLCQCKWSLDSS